MSRKVSMRASITNKTSILVLWVDYTIVKSLAEVV